MKEILLDSFKKIIYFKMSCSFFIHWLKLSNSCRSDVGLVDFVNFLNFIEWTFGL
jgi:hypothetical protein